MKAIRKYITRNLITLITKLGLAANCILLPVLVSAQQKPVDQQKDSVKPKIDSVRIFSEEDTVKKTFIYDSLQAKHDSTATQYYKYFKVFGKEVEDRRTAEYREDTTSTRQDLIIEEIKRLTLEAEAYLNSGLDTAGLDNELFKIGKWYRLACEGVLINIGAIQTHRNLETSYKVLRELLTRTMARKKSIDDYYRKLVDYRNKIDSLYQANILYKVSSDSVAAIRYINKLLVVAEEIKPTNIAIRKTLVSVTELQTTVNRFVNTLNVAIDQIGIFQNELSRKIFQREVSNLGGPIIIYRPFGEIAEYSMIKASVGLIFYVQNEITRILLLLAMYSICALFLFNLKKNLRSKGLLENGQNRVAVLAYPALSSLVIVLNIFQFIFPDPPFIWNAIIWTVSGIALTIIFRKYISKFWMRAWLALFILFLLACADNLLLQASRPERRMMLLLSITGIVGSSLILFHTRKEELKEKGIIYFLVYLIIMQIIAGWANYIGRYNIAKTCLTSGFFSIVIAVLFFGTIRFINDSLGLAAKAYRAPGKKLFRINFDRVGSKAPTLLYVLLVIGWFVLVGRNFYAHKIITGPIRHFVRRERFIGEFSYTVESLLMFVLILYLTGLISRLVSFFGSNPKGEVETSSGKGRTGSWVLITRILVVLTGFLLAMAAIGLPMDRLTIVLSALGVGIGFGLQTLVNNLVSGLIISFEKPVNVGDVVEISGRTGTIKSIGFRSSILSTADGSDVVIPNGDLLNQHLVNWTHKNRLRKVNISTSVAHGTDLQKAIQVLKELPTKDERVISIPAPDVSVLDLNPQGIQMQLSFWVKNIKEWANVKSDIILAMDKALRENGIQIPVPRQDVTFHSAENPEK